MPYAPRPNVGPTYLLKNRSTFTFGPEWREYAYDTPTTIFAVPQGWQESPRSHTDAPVPVERYAPGGEIVMAMERPTKEPDTWAQGVSGYYTHPGDDYGGRVYVRDKYGPLDEWNEGSTFRHELMHKYWYEDMPKAEREAWERQYMSQTEPGVIEHLATSPYYRDNPGGWPSEAFSFTTERPIPVESVRREFLPNTYDPVRVGYSLAEDQQAFQQRMDDLNPASRPTPEEIRLSQVANGWMTPKEIRQTRQENRASYGPGAVILRLEEGPVPQAQSENARRVYAKQRYDRNQAQYPIGDYIAQEQRGVPKDFQRRGEVGQRFDVSLREPKGYSIYDVPFPDPYPIRPDNYGEPGGP